MAGRRRGGRAIFVPILAALLAAPAPSPAEDLFAVIERAGEGHADAQFRMGLIYHEGDIVSKDARQAAGWFRKAAEQGHAEAQNQLGQMYDVGDGVARDHGEAVRWFRKAAEQGNAHGQFNLALKYLLGEGVAKDLRATASWYRKAADQGDPDAQHNLGVMYRDGTWASPGTRGRHATGSAKRRSKEIHWPRSISAPSTPMATASSGTTRGPMPGPASPPNRATRSRKGTGRSMRQSDDRGRSPRRVGAGCPPQGADPGAGGGGAVRGVEAKFPHPEQARRACPESVEGGRIEGPAAPSPRLARPDGVERRGLVPRRAFKRVVALEVHPAPRIGAESTVQAAARSPP